jgi:hypothetical protein
VRVTADEADAMAASCGEPKCWAGPAGFCRTPSGIRRRPHPSRVDDARRAGLLGGVGLAWLCENAAVAAGALVLARQEVAGAG